MKLDDTHCRAVLTPPPACLLAEAINRALGLPDVLDTPGHRLRQIIALLSG
jgi:hypothetical protein